METIKNKKVIYFADPMNPPEDEVDMVIIKPLEKHGIKFEKIHCTERPPFKEIYDILFFDWGGMSMGNSLMESFCREIIKAAKDYPNRMFVMVSTFTGFAMKDALCEFCEDDAMFNIFLNINHFAEQFKKDISQKPITNS